MEKHCGEKRFVFLISSGQLWMTSNNASSDVFMYEKNFPQCSPDSVLDHQVFTGFWRVTLPRWCLGADYGEYAVLKTVAVINARKKKTSQKITNGARFPCVAVACQPVDGLDWGLRGDPGQDKGDKLRGS